MLTLPVRTPPESRLPTHRRGLELQQNIRSQPQDPQDEGEQPEQLALGRWDPRRRALQGQPPPLHQRPLNALAGE